LTDPPPRESAARLRTPRSLPATRAFAWYGEAMRLWRASPTMFALLAAAAIATELIVRLLPVAGPLLTQVLLPLVECSLLYASLAADRGDRPRLRHLVAVLGASPRAIAAVVLASLIGFLGQVLAGSALGVDLLSAGDLPERIGLADVLLLVAAGIAVSLPLTFVAPVALFDDPGLGNAFRESLAAFSRNVAPLLLYGALSLGLFLFGIATSGLGLLLALPWLAASNYAAWKDVFAVQG
jgi:hypothetical protein